ncbi:MAG: hypothetical protein ACP5FK_03615 [bacterium]
MHYLRLKFNFKKTGLKIFICWLIFGLTFTSVLCGEEACYRPGEDQVKINQFVDEFQSHKILCFPVIYRSSEFYRMIENSDELIAEYFSGWDLYPELEYYPDAPDFSETMFPTQWAVFEANMSIFSDYLESLDNSWDYAMTVEILMTNTPSGGQAVGGIQCYILDDQGEDVFSFLMNSHHDMFNDADLTITATDSTEVENLALNSLFTALNALKLQIEEQM